MFLSTSEAKVKAYKNKVTRVRAHAQHTAHSHKVLVCCRSNHSMLLKCANAIFPKWDTNCVKCLQQIQKSQIHLRRESHYGENDGDDDVTFRRSHFTFRTVTVPMSLTWRERGRGICCHGDGNGDSQGHVWQNAKTVFCWSSKRKSERWLQQLRNQGKAGFRSWEKDYCHTRLLRRLQWQFRMYSTPTVIPALGQTAQGCEMDRR